MMTAKLAVGCLAAACVIEAAEVAGPIGAIVAAAFLVAGFIYTNRVRTHA